MSAAPAPDIRLVVVDLDGTLLDGDGSMPADTFETIRALEARGIAFAPASGRQHETIVRQFSEVADSLVVIAENGAYVTRGGVEVSAHPLDLEGARDVVRHCRDLSERGSTSASSSAASPRRGSSAPTRCSARRSSATT